MGNIAIYGAGDFGQRMYRFLEGIGNRTAVFVQSEEPDRKECLGVPVISVKEYLEKSYEFPVFIAIDNIKAVHSVYGLFAEKNYDRKKIFDCRSFIEDNDIGYIEVEEGDKQCNLCGHRIKTFLPSGINTQLFSELQVIGGGYRQNVLCPCCGSMDRNRWVYWALKEKTDVFEAERTVLHFAPEKMIQKKLRENDKCDYYAGDIVLRSGNHKIDVTNIPFQNDFFDYILINHVLEHVENEKKAFSELQRVIKSDGKLILSFPVTMECETIEKKGVLTDEDRLRYYGQRDHVRLYGKDYKERIESQGWKVEQYTPGNVLGIEEINRYGFLRNDILLMCSKTERR